MSTEQLARPILHAHFEGAALQWQLRRGDELIDSGSFGGTTPDPLEELRQLEIRAGVFVRIPAAGLTSDELALARTRGWELI